MNDEDCKKQSNIKTIIELLEEAPPEKVAELLVFISSYLV